MLLHRCHRIALDVGLSENKGDLLQIQTQEKQNEVDSFFKSLHDSGHLEKTESSMDTKLSNARYWLGARLVANVPQVLEDGNNFNGDVDTEHGVWRMNSSECFVFVCLTFIKWKGVLLIFYYFTLNFIPL